MENNILFFDGKDIFYEQTNVFIAHMSEDVSTEEALFRDLKDKLHFPHYFGFNWNSVWDCLRDMSWITERGVIIVHKELPFVDDSILKAYIKLLVDASLDWKPGEAHFLKIYFSERDRAKIGNMMG